MKIDFIDIRRAYFHAKCRRELYISLPDEDWEEGMCGKVNKSIYGTRDAAQNWEEEYNDFMVSVGFKRGLASPCVFYHKSRNIRVVIHGDDFSALGPREGLVAYRQGLEQLVELTLTGHLGEAEDCDREVRVLNRIVRLDAEGLSYEADPRHVEIMFKQMNMQDSKPVVTLGTEDEGTLKG